MKYVYTISKFKTFSNEQTKQVFPTGFSLHEGHEGGGKLLLAIECKNDASDEQVLSQVQQECDRIYFLTGEQLNPTFKWKENPNGSKESRVSIISDIRMVKQLPVNLDRQKWEISLSVQLRLWQLAHRSGIPIASKINLLFQIIEITYPQTNNQTFYPPYLDSNMPPHPNTEAKLLRDLASHGNTKKISSNQLKNYCRHMSISANFHDPTDADFIKVLKKRLNIVESKARGVINDQITRK